jgi:hypothetical protein
MLIRAQPFPAVTYHDKTRSDMIMWRTPYCPVADSDFDPSLPLHRKHAGYGRVVLLFKVALSPNQNTKPVEHSLAFIEEFWPYTPANADSLHDEYGCCMMYSTSPAPTYYVIDVSRILGTAAITKNTAPDRIPYLGLQGVTAQNPGARADAAVPNSTVGSPLYRLNIWYMMWGSMIAARPLPFPAPGPLSDSQTQTMARRREQTPGCAFRTPGTCLVPVPLWMS